MPPTGISLDETDLHHSHDYKNRFDPAHTNGNGAQIVDAEEDDIYTEVRKHTR